MDDLYTELHLLHTLHEEAKETARQAREFDEQIEAKIATTQAAIERQEERDRQIAAAERRAWMRRVNRGGVWAGTIAAAGALGGAAKESPVMAAAIGGGVTIVLGGGAIALAVGIGGSQPTPVAGQRPSISAPPVRPSIPPVAGPERPHRPESRRPRVEPPRPVVIPVRARPGVGPPGGLPKAPAAPPVRPAPPPPEMRQDPPAAVEPLATCVADVQALAIRVQLLCRRA